jgi:hypothetical protein
MSVACIHSTEQNSVAIINGGAGYGAVRMLPPRSCVYYAFVFIS